jgi:hypothetical protein
VALTDVRNIIRVINESWNTNNPLKLIVEHESGDVATQVRLNMDEAELVAHLLLSAVKQARRNNPNAVVDVEVIR